MRAMCKKNLLILYTSLIDGWVGLAHYNKAWEIFDSIRTWKNVSRTIVPSWLGGVARGVPVVLPGTLLRELFGSARGQSFP